MPSFRASPPPQPAVQAKFANPAARSVAQAVVDCGVYEDLISEEVRRYLREVAYHLARAADQIASHGEILNSLAQAALARVGMQQDADMRKISAWAAMLAVPTLIASIYGMNFEHMPALHSTWSYPALLVLMAGLGGLLYVTFRHMHWL